MVCFTKHQFQFPSVRAHTWFRLLDKYYSGIQATVNGIPGVISKAFFDSLPTAEHYLVVTERFWDQCVTLDVMPKFPQDLKLVQSELSAEATKAVDCIRSIIKERLSMQGYEVFLCGDYDIHASELLPVVNNALLQLDTKMITHYNYSPQDQVVFLVANGSYGFKISLNQIRDCGLGTFDLDDGFIANDSRSVYVPGEWPAMFQAWKAKWNVDRPSNVSNVGDVSMDEVEANDDWLTTASIELHQ